MNPSRQFGEDGRLRAPVGTHHQATIGDVWYATYLALEARPRGADLESFALGMGRRQVDDALRERYKRWGEQGGPKPTKATVASAALDVVARLYGEWLQDEHPDRARTDARMKALVTEAEVAASQVAARRDDALRA